MLLMLIELLEIAFEGFRWDLPDENPQNDKDMLLNT